MSTFAAVGPLRNNLAPMVRTVTHPGISDTSYAPAVPSRSAVCLFGCLDSEQFPCYPPNRGRGRFGRRSRERDLGPVVLGGVRPAGGLASIQFTGRSSGG